MTDNEIIKALECCNKDDCDNCPYKRNCKNVMCDVLDLINRQQAEYNNLLEQFRILDCECGRLEKADEKQKAEIERLQKIEIETDDFCRRLCRMRMLNGSAIASYEDLQNYIQEEKSEAVKEFVNKLKEKVSSVYSIRDLHKTIDNLVKEMIGKK